MTPLWAMALAIGLGVQTAISPCPMASNLAAISFVARGVSHKRRVLLAGLLYTIGRSAAYVALAAAILEGLAAGGAIGYFLQRYLNQLLGPLLIVTGLLLLGWIGKGLGVHLAGERVQRWVQRGGMIWAFVLGVLFALSFCPISAGLFFGGLLTLSHSQQSPVLLPLLFGVGTAIPVIGFSLLLALATSAAGKAFRRLGQIEKALRLFAGVAFIVAGLYYCLTYIYGVSLLAW